MSNRISNYDRAVAFIYGIENPITKSLLLNANFQFWKLFSSLEKPEESLGSGFDMLFFNKVLFEIFKEHDVLRRYLDGEEVGKWFDE